jgi:signal transduction histidine kinase/DNA-binding response OmpR family regulator
MLEKLFSIVIEFDTDLRMVAASPVALDHMPWLAERPLLTEAFKIARPQGVKSLEDVVDRSDQLFLMSARDGSFALRGQIVTILRDGAKRPVFCGAPWMFWITSERPDLKLGIRDFSPQDSQLDQLFLMTTEKIMVSDLELVNQQLHDAKSELELAQRARDAFFAQMSHEMRTPLNGVISALALLEEHALPAGSQELLSLIKSSSRNLMHVINYVLDVSKIEADDGTLEAEPFGLEELVKSVVEIVEARAMEKKLGLRMVVEPGLPAASLGDSARVRQTLLNLVNNAIKFTDQGQVTIRVSEVEDRPPWVRIDVADTGIGIPEHLQDRIFEPFFSGLEQGTDAGETGTGLGLDIVRRNVKLMGGELKLESSPDVGSTFTVLLPLEPAIEPVVDAFVENQGEREEGPLRGSVLLVDDNRTNLMLGTMLLEGLGLGVKGAGSGEEAVEAVANQCFCAVLMDISMPGIDGFEATRRIRALPGRRNLPILALTAYASSREQAKAREAGMNDYLTKPVSRAQLVQALQKWLPGERKKPAMPVRKARTAVSLNDTVLEDLAHEIGPQNLALVVETFGSEARDRWRALVAADSASGLAREAHALVSTCRSFGLDAVADALAGIEARARQGQTEDAESLEALGERLERSLDALSTWAPPRQGNSCALNS